MACPITVAKFVGTVSLGLLTGLSYSTTTVTIPSLKLLPTSTAGRRCLSEVRRLNRKHGLRLTGLAHGCLMFAFAISPKHRKHPYLIWMCVASALGTYGVDFWYHRQLGMYTWLQTVVGDVGLAFLAKRTSTKRDEDLVVVEAEDNVNGESVQTEMDEERRIQRIRAWISGTAFAMGIVGLWGDRS